MYTSSTIMNFILEGKICFTETEWKCKTSLQLLPIYEKKSDTKLEFNFIFEIHFLLCVFDVIVIFVN